MSAYSLNYPNLSKGLYLALKEDGFYQRLEAAVLGNDEQKKDALIAYFDYSIVESQEFGECYLPEEQHYGVSIWSYPIADKKQAQKEAKKESFMLATMGEQAFEVYDSMNRYMAEQSIRLVNTSAWYLSIIGINPEFQGQGLGPGLVEKVLEKTDKLGIDTYLETFTKRNLTFYQRLGYRSVFEAIEPTSESLYWLMQRPAA